MFIDEFKLRETERLDEPSVAALAYALRHPVAWPRGFRWNYCRVNGCAMGLALALWPHAIRSAGRLCPLVAAALGMDLRTAEEIFTNNHGHATPESIANRLGC